VVNASLMDCCVYIDRVKRDVFPPAVAEVVTSLHEHLPVFDEHVAREAQRAADGHLPCYLHCRVSLHCRAYVHTVHIVNTSADQDRCHHCGRWAERVNGTPPYFRCSHCSAHTYTAPLEKEVTTPLPATARASLTPTKDCLFALDHRTKEAFLTDCFVGRGVHSDPYLGVTAEIEPLDLTRKLSDIDGRDLLLLGFPFNGRVTYTIRAAKVVADMLERYPTRSSRPEPVKP